MHGTVAARATARIRPHRCELAIARAGTSPAHAEHCQGGDKPDHVSQGGGKPGPYPTTTSRVTSYRVRAGLAPALTM